MKLLFISDIHGSLYYARLAMDAYHKEGASNIIILGDVLYHGPRNPLPREYNPSAVAELLNNYKDRIIAVRGNCDSEVDSMLIEYPMMSDYSFVLCNNRRFFLSHGHIFDPDHLPKLSEGDVFVYGHTHIPVADQINGVYIFNPGSVSLPKENFENTYGVFENDIIKIKDFQSNIIKEVVLVGNILGG